MVVRAAAARVAVRAEAARAQAAMAAVKAAAKLVARAGQRFRRAAYLDLLRLVARPLRDALVVEPYLGPQALVVLLCEYLRIYIPVGEHVTRSTRLCACVHACVHPSMR